MSSESEHTTRKKRIDNALQKSGWKIIHYNKVSSLTSLTNHAVEEYETANGPADYGLVVNGKLYGIIEAKKVEVGALNVLEQAKRYSKGADNTIGQWNKYKVPFLFSTNGELIYHLDVRAEKNLSRQIFAFPSPTDVCHLLMVGWPDIPALSAFCFITLVVPVKYFYTNRFKSFNVCSLSFLLIRIIAHSASKILDFNKFLV